LLRRPRQLDLLLACLTVAASTVAAVNVSAQTLSRPPSATVTPVQIEPPKDALGRDTPRGTVLGFMNAGRGGNEDAAPLYLNTTLRDRAAVDLAHKLYVVLDSRLPARLNELSDRREGSLANPLKPDLNVVGTIATSNGPLELVVERVTRGATGPIWLFSRATLERIPEVYDEIDLVSLDRVLPRFLKQQVAGIRLFEWLAFFLLLPLCYRLAGLLGELFRPAIAWYRRRRGTRADLPANLVPGAVRLILLAIGIRWLMSNLELPLLERQFWWTITTLLTIIALVWMLLVGNEAGESYLARRLRGSSHGEVVAILRLVRRLADAVVVVLGVLVALHVFGVDPTAALAGLGIGGIAVALSAQKTLENVIGGMSIIFDKAVRVGDFVKLGDTVGSVDSIGLRSTRIRTLDRTILSVPNGQIANVNIETLSARDKFWFHHTVSVGFQVTAAQMQSIVDGVDSYLRAHPFVDVRDTIRVRFFRFGPFSLDVELFVYVTAPDWERFLAIQQELLLGVMDIIERTGAAIALPSQTLHVTDARVPARVSRAPSITGAMRRASRESAGTA
jgi:MscS family membrane protein